MLSCRSGPTTALRGATVSAAAGEILAVMGPSGSGKTTLLHCLAGILVPDAGEIWFDGRRAGRRLRRPPGHRPRRAGQLAVPRPGDVVIRLGLRLTAGGKLQANSAPC
jgi:ABC-type cobalamin/Fe3+-siderophores transport system ATPase subunit